MATAAARECLDGLGKSTVLTFERRPGVVAAVPGVDVDHVES